MKKAIVIPCFRAANTLPDVLSKIPQNLVDYVIVVDDGCPDNSGKLIEALNKDKHIVIFHEQNKGVGGAVISGYLKALELGCDIIIKLDGAY